LPYYDIRGAPDLQGSREGIRWKRQLAIVAFMPQTAKNSGITEVIWLFLRSPNPRQPRISAEDEMWIADKSPQKTAKTARPAAGGPYCAPYEGGASSSAPMWACRA
jgi:hypothetical protein